jgi:hypothetical protein
MPRRYIEQRRRLPLNLNELIAFGGPEAMVRQTVAEVAAAERKFWLISRPSIRKPSSPRSITTSARRSPTYEKIVNTA